MSYVNTLSAAQKSNADILVERMKKAGITNPFTHAAILAVISKESSFIPKSENLSYKAARIQKVWPKITAAVAAQLENNPEALGNYVYGPAMNSSLGNGQGEGYKYRGRGYNQITGKANYKSIGEKLGLDLVKNPDLLNDPTVAADAAILFFQKGIDTMARLNKLQQYNATNINDFKTAQDSLNAIYHVNAGVGSTKAKLDADVTGGRAAANSRLGDIFNYISRSVQSAAKSTVEATQAATETVKNNPKIMTAVGVLGTLSLFFLFKTIKP